jgi:signal transduction histidine kinase
MLSFARPQNTQLECGDLNEVCRDVAELMQARFDERNVVLVLDLNADLPPVMIDSKGIYRCILNLVTNALDACDGNMGCIAVTTRLDEERGMTQIEVADTGIGIDVEDQEKVFSVFFSTKGSKGNGLGLAVTQKTIEEHGGTIRFESKKGKGTTFFIDIPIVQEKDT